MYRLTGTPGRCPSWAAGDLARDRRLYITIAVARILGVVVESMVVTLSSGPGIRGRSMAAVPETMTPETLLEGLGVTDKAEVSMFTYSIVVVDNASDIAKIMIEDSRRAR